MAWANNSVLRALGENDNTTMLQKMSGKSKTRRELQKQTTYGEREWHKELKHSKQLMCSRECVCVCSLEAGRLISDWSKSRGMFFFSIIFMLRHGEYHTMAACFLFSMTQFRYAYFLQKFSYAYMRAARQK